MKKVLLAVFIISFSIVVFAGMKGYPNVQINTYSNGNTIIKGSMQTVRNTADNVQYLKCSVRPSGYFVCYARNLDGVRKSCWTMDEKYSELMAKHVSPTSFLTITCNSEGKMVNLDISHDSVFLMKQ